MPQWEGIEDASAKPDPIWFARSKSTEEWKPLRKVDCRNLNDPDRCSANEGRIVIEGGRATAYISERVIKYNFYNAPDRELCCATWFVAPANVNTMPQPLPCKEDSDKIEALYQTALRAFSSLSGDKEFISCVLKEEIPLSSTAETGKGSKDGTSSNPQYVAYVTYNSISKVVAIKKRPTNKLSQVLSFTDTSALLQRGYNAYSVEGEAEEVSLGPVRHLIFVVHGIGEALWSREDTLIPDTIDEMNYTRSAMHKRQIDIWKKECARAEREKRPAPAPPNRIELLPIQWYDRIHSSSGTLKKTLNSVTLNSIPALRAIANDVVFDVLMYLTPEFCQEVLECVTSQICDLYKKFQDIHKHFSTSGGKCSLIGHSLGSVIVWDLLSILKSKQEKDAQSCWVPEVMCGMSVSSAPPNLLSDEDNTYMPTTKAEMKIVLPFEPHFTFFLGSPIGLFLTLRGANTVFEKLRVAASDGNEPSSVIDASPFTLPSGAVYNIFHPSDPVVYRIEPLLFPPDTDAQNIPPPAVLITKEGGMRAHYAIKQFSEDLQKSLIEGTSMFGTLLNSVSDSFKALAGQSGAIDKKLMHKEIKFALGGFSARVDYQIQQGIVENEYFSAVTAHSNYFRNSDVLDFIIQTATEPYSTNNFVQYDH